MTPKMYVELLDKVPSVELSDVVDTLSHDERRELRSGLEAIGCRKLLANLFYDYEAQVWV